MIFDSVVIGAEVLVLSGSSQVDLTPSTNMTYAI